MRIVVTGAAGFLGAHLVHAASTRGHSVVPIVRRLGPEAPVGAMSMESVLADSSCLDGADALIHSAAVRHRHGVDVATYRRSNVDLVARLIEASQGKVRRFVFVSSVGVYGFPKRLPVSESHPFAPKTLYSQTKIDAEKVVRELSPARDLEFTILRPTIIYGPGDRWGMLNKMVAMMQAGTYRLVGDGRNSLHHAFVTDVVEAALLACEHPGARNEDFIVAGPEPTTLGEFSALVAQATGTRLPRLHVPLALARHAATIVNVAAYRGMAWQTREPPINHEKLDVMTLPIWFDTTKARELMGFSARVGYREGVARALNDRPSGQP